MINILTDSTADITKELCKAYHIDTIPMYIQLNGTVYKDGEEIEPAVLFDTASTTGQYPTISGSSPGDFINFFNRNSESIYIGVSSKLSTTFRNAQLAVSELPGQLIDLIDSKSISSGYGQVVVQAAKWRDEGMGFKELGIRIRQMIEKTRGVFILDTPDYIYHGGRCSAIKHFFSSVLKIRPFLSILPNGTLGVLQKVRGSREKAINALLSFFKDQLTNFTIPEIILTHLNCDDEAAYLVDEINAMGKRVRLNTAEVGCVLATHSGPKPIGIAYHVELTRALNLG
jgi:DegV family protein with EDD domain